MKQFSFLIIFYFSLNSLVQPRRLRHGIQRITIDNYQATELQVGFSSVPSASSYKVYAKEWINSTFEQERSTASATLFKHRLSALLTGLDAGRQYLIQVTAHDQSGKIIGSVSERLAKTIIRCYECNSQSVNEDCNKEENIKNCPSGTNSCLNEFRTSDNKIIIMKRCHRIQSTLLVNYPYQYDYPKVQECRKERDGLCACVCKSDLCNAESLPCQPYCSRTLSVPDGMQLRCMNGNQVGSICIWSCSNDTDVISGTDFTVCLPDRTWSVVSPPSCSVMTDSDKTSRMASLNLPYNDNSDLFDQLNDVVRECPRLEGTVENGQVSCSKKNEAGSICRVYCYTGFQAEGGSPSRFCRNGKWTGESPICKRAVCEELDDVDLKSVCSNQYHVGSTCDLVCVQGLELRGASTIKCRDDATWSAPIPHCDRKQCSTLIEELVGMKAKCSTSSNSQIICGFVSELGYRCVNDSSIRVCSEGRWDGELPICQKILCPLPQDVHENLIFRCNDENSFGSNCHFSCLGNYQVDGEASSLCNEDGSWSHEFPTCKKLACEPLSSFAFNNGSVSCTDHYNIDSTCEVVCQTAHSYPQDYIFSKVRCELVDEHALVWNGEHQSCEKMQCDEVTKINGVIATCNGDDRYPGTECVHVCAHGYHQVDEHLTRCEVEDGKAKWMGSTPRCKRKTCPELSVPVKNGVLECTDLRFVGSVCTATCNEDYVIDGESTITCDQASESWDRTRLYCKPKICEWKNLVKLNSSVVFDCGSDNANLSQGLFLPGHQCEPMCRSGYKFTDEYPTVKCTNNGDWNIDGSLQCVDIDECENDNGNCSQLCENHNGFYTCSCHRGFEIDADGRSCKAITCVTPMLSDDLIQINCTSDVFEVGTYCFLSCATGHQINNLPAHRKCVIENSEIMWNEEFPTCEKIQCEENGPIANGYRVCSDGTNYKSKCKNHCDEGFENISPSISECGEDGMWNAPRALCRRKRCIDEEVTITHGIRVCDGPSIYGSECNYTCDAGYQLFTSDGYLDPNFSTFCDSSGKWSSLPPTCVPTTCPQLAADRSVDANATVDCSDTFNHLSICKLLCSRGYYVIGEHSTSCDDREWSNDLGTCQKFQCDVIPALEHGNMTCTNGRYYNSSCQFSCTNGYQLSGHSNIICQDDHSWSKLYPTCKRQHCDDIYTSLVHHSTMTCNKDNLVGSKCATMCNAGYKMVMYDSDETMIMTSSSTQQHVHTSVCLETLVWSSPKPECVLQECDTLEADENGKLLCDDGRRFNSTCRLQCNEGYLALSSVVQCQHFETWFPNLGSCERIECNEVDPPAHGQVSCEEGRKYESTCYYSCDEGYELNGAASTTCGSDYQFVTTNTTCTKTKCPENHATLRNGVVVCTDDNLFGSSCNFECNAGYNMKISDGSILQDYSILSTCGHDQKWNIEAPICEKKTCPNNEETPEGQVTCTDGNNFQSICELSCNKGYQQEGDGSVECENTGIWSTRLGKCKKIPCPEITLESGSKICDDRNLFQSTCKFTCDEGFQIDGSLHSKCQSDANWSPSTPKCQKVTCPPLSFRYARTVCTDEVNYQSKCRIQCDVGYELIVKDQQSENFTFQCLSTGQWSRAEELAFCQRKRCSDNDGSLINARIHGNVECSNSGWMVIGTKCKLSCLSGYQLVGNDATMCSSLTDWSPTIGYCEKKRCPILSPLVNVQTKCSEENLFGSECQFTCDDGYELHGNEIIRCLSDQTYDNKIPTCQKVKCSLDEGEFTNGHVKCSDENFFQSICTYQCDEGYQIQHSKTNTKNNHQFVTLCTSDKSWNSTRPQCVKKECSSRDPTFIKAQLNGNVTCTDSYLFQSKCTLKCHSGYELNGNENTTCGSSSQWTQNIGHCTKKRCRNLTTPTNGGTSCTNEDLYQSVCTFHCKDGYQLMGSPSTVCKEDGLFSITNTKCQEITCLSVGLQNGFLNCTKDDKYGSNCDVYCDPGYELSKESPTFLTCTSSGEWDSKFTPVCQPLTCPNEDNQFIEASGIGTISCSNHNKYLSKCQMKCHEGYMMIGNNESFCTNDGTWSDKLGFCERKTCTRLLAPSSGSVVCTDGNNFDSVCQFSCFDGYYLVGSKSVRCEENGVFQNLTSVSCDKKECDMKYLELEHGRSECSDENLFMSQCSFYCDVGYEIVTNNEPLIKCLADGTWDHNKSTCTKKKCSLETFNIIKAQTRGHLTCSDKNNYQSQCRLECNIGYGVSGNDVIKCEATGNWSEEFGSCEKITCSQLEEPLNGHINCSFGNEYLSECYVACEPGYTTEYSKDTKCRLNQTWSDEVPQCNKIHCHESDMDLENGKVVCSDGNLYESQCSYQCNQGFTLSTGSEVTTLYCTASASWSQSPPICMAESCTGFEDEFRKAKLTGSLSCTDHHFVGSVCQLSCPYDLQLVSGIGQVSCLPSLTWSDKIGSCEEKKCTTFDELCSGAMSCTEENEPGSICTFECNVGYQIDGAEQSVCLGNGSFSNPLPKCTRKRCPEHYLEPEFASVTCNDTNVFGSVCTYSCFDKFKFFDEEGYLEVGSNISVSCDSDGHWDRPLPMCERVTCPTNTPAFIKADESGFVNCSEGNRVNTECEITCDDESQIVGSKRSICQVNGKWNTDIGYCKKIECKKFDVPQNGRLECKDDNKFGSVCEYNCGRGYHMKVDIKFDSVATVVEEEKLTNPVQVFCQADSIWDLREDYLPECEKNTCPSLGVLENGYVTCTDENRYLSECFWKCEPGFQLVDPIDNQDNTSVITQCLDTGSWSLHKLPMCERMECTNEELNKNPHGTVVCLNGRKFASKCMLTCHQGYSLEGATEHDVITCGKDGIWDVSFGVCTAIECEKLRAPEHGSIVCSNGEKLRSRCKVICEVGYKVDDPELNYNYEKGIECRNDGSWCGEVPNCIESVGCDEENTQIKYGKTACTNGSKIGSICNYTCEDGFVLSNNSSPTSLCSEDSTWSASAPECERIKCVNGGTMLKEAIKHGNLSCTNKNNFESKCELSCQVGYELVGNSIIFCQADSDWNQIIGTCKQISCAYLEGDDNSILTCSDHFNAGSSCSAECLSGYQPVDGSRGEITCLSSGKWMGAMTNCDKTHCMSNHFESFRDGTVECTDNFNYQSQCTFKCNTGFHLYNVTQKISLMTLQCTSSGDWNHKVLPHCRRSTCPPMSKKSVENGFVQCTSYSFFESTCKLSCNDGYEIDGDYDWSRCEADGIWWPPLATCKKRKCVNFEAPPNTFIRCSDERNVGSVCYYSGCAYGYEVPELSLMGFVTCDKDARWSGSIARCQKRKCDFDHLKIANGRATCNRRNNIGSRCNYKCDDGYILHGNSSAFLLCCFDGKWSDEKPTCVKSNGCTSLGLEHGRVNCYENGDCFASCERGSSLVGYGKVKCTDQDGIVKVEPKLGTCKRHSCREPDVNENTEIECSDSYFYLSKCYTKCKSGYHQTVNVYHSVQCTSSGDWFGSLASCIRTTCPIEEILVENGNFTLSDHNYSGSVATYQCEIGYKIEGPDFSRCQSTGSWTSPLPTCKQMLCPPLNVENSSAKCFKTSMSDQYIPGTHCSISCNEGYKMSVDKTDTLHTCLPNGRWSGAMPLCKRACNPDYLNINNGDVKCTDSNFEESTCKFSCSSKPPIPLELFGDSLSVCEGKGNWSQPKPCCARSCPSYSQIDLFFVLESHSNMGYENWKKVLEFVEEIVEKFNFDRNDGLLSGLFRYHREVDIQNEIRIGEVVNIQSFRRTLKFLPYGGIGASNSDVALQHAFTSSLQQAGNRKIARDFVIVITSRNDVIAQQIESFQPLAHHKHIKVISINVGSSRTQNKEMSQYHDHYETFGHDNLNKDFVNEVVKSICNKPCD